MKERNNLEKKKISSKHYSRVRSRRYLKKKRKKKKRKNVESDEEESRIALDELATPFTDNGKLNSANSRLISDSS